MSSLHVISTWPPSMEAQRSHGKRTVRRLRHLFVVVCLVSLVLGASGVAGFEAVTVLPTHVPAVVPVTTPAPLVKPYYLALGDSLAFGYQPDLNWVQGYAQQLWYDLQQHGSRHIVNFGCSDVTTQEFIQGGCPLANIRHDYYNGSQLAAAVAFLNEHKGEVSPVTLDLGANNVLGDINPKTCTVNDFWYQDLSVMDSDLDLLILPKLEQALTGRGGQQLGQLVMMNYYNPYQRQCPGADSFIRQLNRHLAADAASYSVPIVDVYSAFNAASAGKTSQTGGVCRLTWMCGWPIQDIHPTSTGYRVIADTIKRTLDV